MPRIKMVNNIEIHRGIPRNKVYTYTCVCPDKTKKVFSHYSKEEGMRQSVEWCKNNTKYTKRDTYHRSKDEGAAINVCLTYGNLVYLLGIVPNIERNVFLRRKLEKGLEQSRSKKEAK
jgi:hypothetical protein